MELSAKRGDGVAVLVLILKRAGHNEHVEVVGLVIEINDSLKLR